MLRLAADGDSSAAAEVLPLVYNELRALAGSRMKRASPDETLQPTALVHEAYVRLVGSGDPGWEGRGHFFFAAARAMQDILVERARSRASLKKGGGRSRVDLESLSVAIDAHPDSLLALKEAMDSLRRKSERQYQLVMLRFFAGLTMVQAAEVLNVDERTLRRDWEYVRARLHRDLEGEGSVDEDNP